jgi:protein-tyrosine phosphatase
MSSTHDNPSPLHASASGEAVDAARRLRHEAAAWLALLAPLFFLSYGFANALAARRADVPSVVFAWERMIPFWDWTIYPYSSIDVVYPVSLFLCTGIAMLRAHALRLLTAQLIAVSCFIAFPLRFAHAQPMGEGLAYWLFVALRSFDQPFNQAPSLHIALLVVLWDALRGVVPPRWRWALHAWAVSVAISVLTTYQHHFIDVPTGALLGVFCLWLWPLHGQTPLRAAPAQGDPARRRLALAHTLAATACLGAAFVGGAVHGAWLWLCWPGVSLLLVALHYARFGAEGVQKSATGRLSLASRWLLAPYGFAAWLCAARWTGRRPPTVRIARDVLLGPLPSARQARASAVVALVDVSAELPSPQGVPARCVPMLARVAPTPEQLDAAIAALEAQRATAGGGDVLLCCTAGSARSACVAIAWLLASGREETLEDAIVRVRTAQPRAMLRAAHRQALAAWSARP